MGSKGRHPQKVSDGGGYWKWLKVRPGAQGSGWLAGDTHVYPAHMGRPSFVCTKTLTGARLNCDACAEGKPVGQLGYVPFFRDDNVPCVLIVHEYTFELLDRIPHLSPILWGRKDDDDGDAVWVKRHVAGAKYFSTLPARQRKQDLTIATCRYWKRPDLLPDLARWFAGVTDDGDESPPPELVERAAAATAKAGARRQASRKETVAEIAGVEVPPLLADGVSDMLRRNRNLAAMLSKNGKHD